MPRWAKVVIWAVVFALCAAAGAWFASRTDPFPPGVEDPGARPAEPTETPSEGARPIWTGSFRADTEHRLHVGGTCRSDWRGTYRVRLLEDGSIDGVSGIAALDPGSARCDFDQGQLQAATAELWVGGTWEQEDQRYLLRLRFRAGQLDPVGSLDVGGFLATIGSVRPELEPIVDLDSYGDDRELNLSDGNQGEYVAAYGFLASCRSGCD